MTTTQQKRPEFTQADLDRIIAARMAEEAAAEAAKKAKKSRK